MLILLYIIVYVYFILLGLFGFLVSVIVGVCLKYFKWVKLMGKFF